MPEPTNPVTNQPVNQASQPVNPAAIPLAQNPPTQEPKAAKEPAKEKSPKTKHNAGAKKRTSLSIITLGSINLICVIALTVLLSRLPQKAEHLKLLRNQSLKTAGTNLEDLEFEIENSQAKLDKLTSLFPSETTLLDFIKGIDALKKQGIVTRFSFASNKPVKDRTKFTGLPIIIEFRGTWGQTNSALKIVENLPFLIRPINIEVKQSSAEGLVTLKYGGILYVSETFNSN